MDKKFKKLLKFLVILISGIIFFSYIFLLSLIGLNILPTKFFLDFKFSTREIFSLVAGFIAFLIAYFFIFDKYIQKEESVLKIEEIFYFLLSSIAILILIFINKYFLYKSNFSNFVKFFIILISYFILILPVLSLAKFISKVMFFNFLIKLNDKASIFEIYEGEQLLKMLKKIISQILRYNMKLGIIGFYFKDLSGLEKKYKFRGIKFLRKQINYLLTEYTRAYEVVGRNREKDIYMIFMFIQKEDELKFALERFRKIVADFRYQIYMNEVKPVITMAGFVLGSEKLKSFSDESQIIDFVTNNIKSQKQNEKIYLEL